MLFGTPSCSEACLFFSNDLLGLWLQSVQYDLEHDLARMANEVYRSVVLALLRVAFLEKSDDRVLDRRCLPLSCLPDLVADCQECND